jgi:TPR repeat protein
MRRPFHFLTIALCALSAAQLTAGPVEDAEAAWKLGDMKKAASLLEPAVKAGDAAALYLQGRWHELGAGAAKSDELAVTHYEKAAEKGSLPAKAAWGRMLATGKGGDDKRERGRFLVGEAAEAGSMDALMLLAQIALQSQPPDDGAALFYYRKAMEQKHPAAMVAVAGFFDDGRGVVKDEQRATALVLEAAKLGEPLAMNEMGLRYQNGRGVVKDNVAAVGWFSMGAQYGLPAAQVTLGNCYESGNGCRADADLAGRNYSAAAKQGHPAGQFLLAGLFERGAGTAANPVFAWVNYSRAAKSEYPGAAAKAAEILAKLTPEQKAEGAKLMEQQ